MASTRRLLHFAAVSVLSGVVLLGCDDNPVAGEADEPETIVANPGFAVVDAGEGRTIRAFVRSRTGEPTLDAVSFTACDDKVTVSEDPSRVSVEPPDRAIVTGQTLGESCVVVSGAGRTDTVPVVVEAAGLVVTSAPDTLRAGQSGEVVVTAVDVNGEAVGPFERTDAAYSSADTAIVKVTDEIGSIDTRVAGGGVVTATWTGVSGVTRSVDHSLAVLPNVPAGAEFDSTTFGALDIDSTSAMPIRVTDVHGNANLNPDEVLSATIQSSDPSVADATVELEEDPESGTVQPVVSVVGNASGSAEISGEVETSEGTFPVAAIDVTIVSPAIAAVVPGSGGVGADVVINGTDLTAAGFDTEVLVAGFSATEFISNATATQIVLQMPNAGAVGDHDVVVSVGGVVSEEDITWNQTAEADPSEPNDDEDQAEAIVLPFNDVRSFQGEDLDDFYSITLATDATVVVDLEWNVDAKDLDILITDDAGDLNLDCLGGATGDKPEHLECELPAGSHRVWINDFTADGALVSYELTVQLQ